MADFKTCLIKDSILADITDKLEFAVMSGGANNTYQQFSAVTQSASSIVYNVQIPSESIVISREVMQQSTITFTLTVANVPAGQRAFDYGLTDSLQAFPLNSLYTTCTSTINNTNVSVNLQDVLPSLLRLNDSRQLYRYNSTCPTLPDQAYLNYSDGVLTGNNPLASWNNQSYDVDLAPRGAYPLNSCVIVHTPTVGPVDASVVSTNIGDTWRIVMQVTVTEPLFLSPFIFGDCEYNCGGFAGINTMNFVFNVDSTCKRMFSTANSAYTHTITLGDAGVTPAFQNSKLLYHFLSTQPSDLIPSRIVTPYHDFPRYLSLSNNATPIASGQSSTVTSQNIQLNQLPDYFIITARKPMSSQTIKDSSSFMTINSISINLNNQSGLLSSATAQDLWKISMANHSTQSWQEFSGSAFFNDNDTGAGLEVSTTGSMLILSPALNLSIPDYLSSSSIGQFNFQFNINVTNFYNAPVAPELCIICVNSGVFVSQMGSSNIYTGVLTKDMVLSAKEQQSVSPVSSVQYRRLVGGSLGNLVSSAVRKMRKGMSGMKERVESVVDPAVRDVGSMGRQALRGLAKHF